MNKKLLITLGAAIVIVVAGVASAGIVAYNSCGYDAETGNYLYDGNKVAAHGTMDSAMQCALQGMLPDVVADRLGIWGDKETKEEAGQIILMDELKKEEKRQAKE
jgi:hypothetical protein